MTLWLTRQRDGAYMLTLEKPIIARIGLGTGFDAYVAYGDPIGVRHLCAAIVEREIEHSLRPLESERVELNLTTKKKDG